jgi:glycosyltransferase involved in cell wall biosynthesis
MNVPDTSADVSVIIPAYRASRSIKRALTSIAAQSIKPREVIVVDDGSDDGTYEEARTAGSEMGELKIDLIVIRQPHAGAGAARNRAIAQAVGRYVAFLDADDEWLPTKLERSLPYFDDPGVVLVAHNNLHFGSGF